MDVADVLRDRTLGPDGLHRMVVVSLVVHAAAATLVLVGSLRVIGRSSALPRNVMTITIGGAGEGPRNGGMTPAAAQPVQVATPPEEMPKRQAARPPAAKTPEMVLPTKTSAKPARTSATPPSVRQAPDQARGTTPTRGARVSSGNAVANTAARGQGFGLSTGGGAGSGSFLDVANFCCPDYIVTMIDRIRSVWTQNQGASGQCVVKFTIQRSGLITEASLETPSGSYALDNAALRAVMSVRTLLPLPDAFPNPTLTVHLNFQYK